MLPEFELWTPESLPEALEMLAKAAPDIVPLAGGTNLVVDMRSGRHSPKIVLDLSRLTDMRGMRTPNSHIWLGGGVTIAELLDSPLIEQSALPLRQAARLFASPLVRNRATLAGNLVDGSPAADTAPPLLALDAEVELASLESTRHIPLASFFLGVRRTLLQPDELLTSVSIPVPSPRMAFGYTKLGLRKADAISVVSAATAIELDPDGRCTKARIALGSVAPIPLRACAAEDCLQGELLSPEAMAEAADLAARAVSPISDLRASADYRRRMVAILVRRLVEQAASQLIPVE